MSMMMYLLILLVTVFYATNGAFICEDGTPINITALCDGRRDCPDGSDEMTTFCSRIICPPNMLRCYYGACVSREARCNGTSECYDRSDESQCGKTLGSCECRSGECISLDDICNGINNCEDGSDETQDICRKYACPKGTFRCRYGGCIAEAALCDGFVDCPGGSDESNTTCENLKCKYGNCETALRCPPIISPRLLTTCWSPGKEGLLPCDKPVPLGTIAHYDCKAFYVPTENNTEAHCQIDGTWNRDILQCIPECGIADASAQPLIVHGWDMSTSWPWHAALYVLEEGEWTYSCAGTLISETAILTAAHCTWKKPKKYLRVAVGKYYTDYKRSQGTAQFRGIGKVVMQPLYQDFKTNYGSDIAVLFLDQPLEFTEHVKPACLDWNLVNLKSLTTSSLGTVAGMGFTENGTSSETLMATKLPFISDYQCLKEQSREFKKYVTYTTFCAGWRNGTSVCNGDSGGGVLFRDVSNSNRWTLQGIVSISPRKQGTNRCDPKYYTVFTKVSLYLNWLKSIAEASDLGL